MHLEDDIAVEESTKDQSSILGAPRYWRIVLQWPHGSACAVAHLETVWFKSSWWPPWVKILDHLEDGDGDVEPHGVVADEPEEDEEGGLPANWPWQARKLHGSTQTKFIWNQQFLWSDLDLVQEIEKAKPCVSERVFQLTGLDQLVSFTFQSFHAYFNYQLPSITETNHDLQ